MTGATHSRELITIQMVLFELCKLIQNGIINQDPETVKRLMDNKFIFVPVVNVDGLHTIEDNMRYRSDNSFSGGQSAILTKRKNLNNEAGLA